MIVLITNILWILYSMLEGFREGFYWYFKGISKSKNDFEIHPVFASQRGIILILIGVMLSFTIGWFSILNTVGMALVFSFFHNGSYYVTRNRIDSKVYPLKWKSQSTTSTAKLTKIMTYRNRTIFMIIGLIIQVAYLLFGLL
jgi:hypothetical protein